MNSDIVVGAWPVTRPPLYSLLSLLCDVVEVRMACGLIMHDAHLLLGPSSTFHIISCDSTCLFEVYSYYLDQIL